jgi:hypothetical protein
MYEVSVEMTGFKKLNRGNVEIRIATRQELDVALEIGNMQETVDVTGEVALLETTSSQRGQGLSTQFMNTLPFFSGGIRNPRTFVNYMPGANPSTELSVSGSGGRAQEVLIDGASATIPESGGVSFNFPAAEMFGEFKLLTSTRHGVPQHAARYLECECLGFQRLRAGPAEGSLQRNRCGNRRARLDPEAL